MRRFRQFKLALPVVFLIVGLCVARPAFSGYTPQTPPSNTSATALFVKSIQGGVPISWFDANVGAHSDTSFATSCTNNVQCQGLRDQSGYGFDLKQATKLNAPYWKSNQINGLPALVSLNYSNTNLEYMQGSQDLCPRDVTVFAVLSAPWAVITSSTLWFWNPVGFQGSGASAGMACSPYSAATQDWSAHSQVIYGAGYSTGTRPRSYGVNSTQIGADNTWHVFTWTVGAYSSCRTDGVITSTASTSGTGTPVGVFSIGMDTTTSGTSRLTAGSIAEVGLVSGILPRDQIWRVEQYLASKYALTVSQQ